MCAVIGLLGIHDIVAKSVGFSNVNAIIEETFDELSKLSAPKVIDEKRDKKLVKFQLNQLRLSPAVEGK